LEEHLISVIIPVYNGEKTIVRCLDSVCNQTYPKTEIIVVNDGSADGSKRVIEEYVKQQHVENLTLIDQANAGASAARNRGIEKARGEFLTFVDCDDTIKTDFLQTLYNVLVEQKAEISVCGCNNVVSGTDTLLYCDIPSNHSFMYLEKQIVFWGAPWGKLYSAEMIKKHNCMFSEGEKLEDDPYSLMVHTIAGRIVKTDYIGYNYYVDNPESSMGFVKKRREIGDIFPEKAYRFAIENVISNNANLDEIKIYECVAFISKLYRACRHNSYHSIKTVSAVFQNLEKEFGLTRGIANFKVLPAKVKLEIRALRLLLSTKLLTLSALIFTRF